MPASQITVLPIQEMYLVRKISLFKDFGTRKQPVSGTLIYGRPFDKDRDYIMHLQQMEKIERCIYGYQEDEFPHDILDDVILDAIRKHFPKAERKSDILMFDMDKDKYKRLLEQYKVSSVKLMVSESLKLLEDDLRTGNALDAMWFHLKIYSLSKYDNDYFTKGLGTLMYELSENQEFAEFENLCSTSLFTIQQMLNVKL